MPPTLITPRQSWWERLKDGVKNSSPQVKQALIGSGVAVLLAVVGGVGGCWNVNVENSRLKANVAAKDEEIHKQEGDLSSLRHENQNLVAENNRWKLLVNPIERKAREIYPDLEASAAIAKLARDLEDTKNLATRAEFKPITAELREKIVAGLKTIERPQIAEKVTFHIGYEHGSMARAKLAEELANLLKDSGIPAVLEGSAQYSTIGQSFETPVRVFMNLNGPAQNTYRDAAQALSRFLTGGIVALGNPNTATNEILVQIMGIPAFLPDGSVNFE